MKNLISSTILILCLTQICFGQSDNPFIQKEITSVEFTETIYQFGEIKSGEKVSHAFKFKNIGDAPLVITNAKGSCGCTVPFFPKVPILPGESSEIVVEFDSKNKKGKQSKRITILANTEPQTTFLTVTGEVLVEKTNATSKEVDATTTKRNKEKERIEAFNPSCFAIYPNPSNDYVQVELKEFIGQAAVIEIYNEMGQKVMDRNIESISQESTRFEVSSFSSGIYMISIQVKNSKPMTQCFVVTGR